MTNEQLPADEAPDEDMAAIRFLLDEAQSSGMEVEAVWSFAHHLKKGGTFWDAANHAIREWDL